MLAVKSTTISRLDSLMLDWARVGLIGAGQDGSQWNPPVVVLSLILAPILALTHTSLQPNRYVPARVGIDLNMPIGTTENLER